MSNTLYDDARRIVAAAEGAGLSLRLLGGIAVFHLCPTARHPDLSRSYKDIDMIGRAGERTALQRLFSEQGYEPDTNSTRYTDTHLHPQSDRSGASGRHLRRAGVQRQLYQRRVDGRTDGLIIPSYAGGNIYLSLLFCALLALPTACVYAFLSAAMPRSGGDYVYVSRVLGPAAGMMGSWNMTIWWILYGGVPSAFLATYGVAPFCRVLAAMTGNTGQDG